MKRWVFFLGIFFCHSVFAEMSEEMHLIFPDRTLTLNFSAQAELLSQTPSHFLHVGEVRLPIDFEKNLPLSDGVFSIETQFQTEISPEALYDFLKASSIIREQKDHKTVEIRLEGDEILFDGTPRDGFEIDQKRLVQLINIALAQGTKYVRVPAKKVFSDVVVHPDLQAQGIQEIVAVGESNFSGSSESRRQNIVAGAKKFNGKIIGKGKTFSFNQILENVREEDGFVRELVIKGNKTEKELGGGVCQVSTTAFRAALEGGFPVRARRNHSYAVPYYKPYGLDAAIYLGALDLRFYNDSDGDILIQTFVEGDNLFFVFYGTDDGRKVELEGPFISHYKTAPDAIVYETEDLPLGEIQQIDQAHDGFETEWIRRVEKDGEIETQSFVSEYRPWPAKQRVGTKISKKF